MTKNIKIIDTITLKHGMEIDRNEAWRKLTHRQHGGDPARGMGELAQNGFDGYDSTVGWSDRKLVINSGPDTISIVDYGEGMSREKLRLLVTLGGTDKANDKTKLGQFGIGFCSMFHPDLGTRRVVVQTRCEGHAVELVFTVIEQGKIPQIKTRLLDKKLPFATRISVTFGNVTSPDKCLAYARKWLKSLPCNVRINGKTYPSIWEEARQEGLSIFESGQCMGFVRPSSWRGTQVALLRRFEKVMDLSIEALMTGGHSMKYDLRDWARKETPFVNDVTITINCNDLNVPISRDGFYLDGAYSRMTRVVNEQLLHQLDKKLNHYQDQGIVIANHYVLKNKIAAYVSLKLKNEDTGEIEPTIKTLAKAKIYPVNGKSEKYSLLDIAVKRTGNLPVFYSPGQTNLRWLGGAFKHDFIVLPPWQGNGGNSVPGVYDAVFRRIFSDVVNLDDVEYDHDIMAELVKRDIICKESLSPKIQLTTIRKLNEKELNCIRKIDRVLSHDAVKKAIAKNLNLQVSEIRAAFFDLKQSGGVIATGFLDENGTPLEEAYYTNFAQQEEGHSTKAQKPILLGLQKDNALIDSLMGTEDPDMPYYLMMYLVQELSMCQKLLVPYTRYFHVVKTRLAKDMRQALIDQFLSEMEVESEMEALEQPT